MKLEMNNRINICRSERDRENKALETQEALIMILKG